MKGEEANLRWQEFMAPYFEDFQAGRTSRWRSSSRCSIRIEYALLWRSGEQGEIMAKLDFVDAHVHFYDMQHPELFYGHWQPGVPHPFLGEQIQRLAERSYSADDYIAETRSANVVKAVHVQAAIGTQDPVAETEWLQEAADRTGFPHGIVAYADLRDPNVEGTLERHCQSPT